MGVDDKRGTRTERLDLRLTKKKKKKKQKEILERYAKKSRRTVSSLIYEWIEILEKDDYDH